MSIPPKRWTHTLTRTVPLLRRRRGLDRRPLPAATPGVSPLTEILVDPVHAWYLTEDSSPLLFPLTPPPLVKRNGNGLRRARRYVPLHTSPEVATLDAKLRVALREIDRLSALTHRNPSSPLQQPPPFDAPMLNNVSPPDQ